MEKPLSPTDELEYCDMIIKRISIIIAKRNIKQLDLSVKSQLGQSTLSKILKGETKLTLQYIFRICKALEIEPVILFSPNFESDLENDVSSFNDADGALLNENYINEQILIRNTLHPAFKGYVNTKFYFYCHPTISSETNLLEGELSYIASKEQKFCKANLVLYTGQTDKNNQKVFKSYSGELVISLAMGACYSLLIEREIGEIIFINFSHSFLFNQELICKVATMISTSSGGNRLPVMQRAVLSKNKLDINKDSASDEEFIKGQLKLNESDIIMKQSELSDILEDKDEKYTDVRSFLLQCKKYFDETKDEYLCVDEGKLRGLDYPQEIKAKGLGILRNKSISSRYNKISTKTDEYVFKYIDGKNRQA